MELFKLFGTIAINNASANSAIEDTTGKAEGAGSKIVSAFKKIGTAVVTYMAVDKIVQFGNAMIDAASDAQAMESQFTQVFGDMESSASDSLSTIAEQTGVLENRMKGSYTKIAAFAKTSGMDTADALDLANRSMIAVADSAAFYDRSLEDTTETLQSFLKGNYENDSALGLSCTETTRNTKANELYGKSFQELSESQKQLTLLAMVEDANKLSGAMGQASRESDTWTNQTGNLKQAWKDMLAVLGSPILELAIPIVKGLADAVAYVTEKIPTLKDNILPFIEEYMPGIIEVSEILMNIWNDVLVPTISTIVNWFKQFVSTIGEAVMPAIQDIISKFTELYQAIKEAVMTYIVPFVQNFITMLQELWVENQDKLQKIGNLFQTIFDAIAGLVAWFVDTFKGYILPFFEWFVLCVEDNLGNIKDTFQSIFDVIGGIVDFFINLFKGNWSGMWESIKAILNSALEAISNAFYTAFSTICSIFSPLIDFFANIWESIETICSDAWESITSLFKEVGVAISDAVTGTVKSAINTVLNGAIGIINKFINAINSVIGVINEIPGVELGKLDTLDVPQLAEGGILEKGEVGLLEGNGAEAVVPLHNNKKWISAVAEDMDSAMGGKSSEKLDKVIELLEQLNEFMPELANISIKLNNREVGRAVRQVTV